MAAAGDAVGDADCASKLERFKAACFSFFTDGDPQAKAVLLQLDTLLDSLEASECVLVSLEGQTPLSCACGVTYENLQSADHRAAYRRAKDEARSRAHAALHARRQERLRVLLDDRPALVNGDSCVWANASRAMAALKRFSAKHAATLGAQPFFRGLLFLIIEQQRQRTVVRWHIDAAVLTDAATEEFIADSIELFRQLPLLRVKIDLPNSLALELAPTWSDAMLTRLVKSAGARHFLPSIEDTALPTGRTEITSVPRTNIDGSLDETPPILDLVCVDFCSLL